MTTAPSGFEGEGFPVRRAFAENFNPDATQLKQLVSFLLYIDDTTAAPAAANVGFAVDLCKEIPAGSIN